MTLARSSFLSSNMLALAVLSLLLVSCSPENRAQRLKKADRIFVTLEPSSLDSLNAALSPSLSNYGEVTAQSFKPVLKQSGMMVNGAENYGPVIYTSTSLIPSQTLYMPMRVRDFYQLALDKGSMAISVDPTSGDGFVMSRAEVEAALPNLPASEPFPLEVFVTK